jgi:hypothetical protein
LIPLYVGACRNYLSGRLPDAARQIGRSHDVPGDAGEHDVTVPRRRETDEGQGADLPPLGTCKRAIDLPAGKEGVMKTIRISARATRFFAAAGLALSCALGIGYADAWADHADADNYFDLHPGPVNSRTGIDPHDPYAPVDLGPSSAVSLRAGGAEIGGSAAGDEAVDPCSPQRCRAW